MTINYNFLLQKIESLHLKLNSLNKYDDSRQSSSVKKLIIFEDRELSIFLEKNQPYIY